MSLFNKLFKKTVPAAAPETSGGGALSLASQIPENYLPLWQLHKQRQLVEVKIQGSSRAYQSMVLALDIERGLLWLDDLFPQQLLLEVGDEVCIRHHRQGEQLQIRGPVIALGANFGALGFALVLPQDVHYRPRREAQRFSVSGDTPTMVKLRPLGQEPCMGMLQDISAGGLKANVAGNLLAQLRHGSVLPLLEFSLGDLHIRCKARVCAFRICRAPYRCTQLSLEFIDIPDEKHQALARLLSQPPVVADMGFRAA